MKDHFNPSTYTVIDNISGEEVDVTIFIDKAKASGWEKAYAGVLAEYIGIAGNSSAKVLGHLIKERDGRNIVIGTIRKTAEQLSISDNTVGNVFSLLMRKDFMKKIANGVYMLTPKMIRYGSTPRGAMLLRVWDDLSDRDDQKKVHKELLEAGI